MSAPESQLTPDQFEALAELLGGGSVAVREALRLVMVEGLPQADAARMMDVPRQNLNRRFQQALAVIALAERVAASHENRTHR